ncbi:hypothetical protein [Streptomyces misionensis]|uniref:hypothetical protein n=1 Tax=Streptomyces misionensis TaxID=67331 RepID=UPI0036C793FC
MNTGSVNAAAGVIHAAQQQGRTAAGIAMALESAQLLQSPETADELERLRLEAAGLRSQLALFNEWRTADGTRMAELLAERHSTNEALSDAAEALREQRDRIADLEAELYTERAQHRTTLEQRNAHAQELLALRGGRSAPYTATAEAHAQMREGLTRYFSGKEEAAEGEHYAVVHHDYRVSHDLPPLGGAS